MAGLLSNVIETGVVGMSWHAHHIVHSALSPLASSPNLRPGNWLTLSTDGGHSFGTPWCYEGEETSYVQQAGEILVRCFIL